MPAYDTLISASQLVSHITDPEWVIVDCRFSLADTDAGQRVYCEAHIPGARYAHLDKDLAGTVTPHSGRHPLPDPEKLAAYLSDQGINNSTQVVVYDDLGGAMAARLWWLLRWLGHDAVALLDGGLPAWQRNGYPLDSALPKPKKRQFIPHPDAAQIVTTKDIPNLLKQGYSLVDARAAERFSGEYEPVDAVAGHVPGALNLPFGGNLDRQGIFLPATQLHERFAYRVKEPDKVIHMCGSGVTACHNLLAMMVANMHEGRLYPGSWSEWITDPARPVATTVETPDGIKPCKPAFTKP